MATFKPGDKVKVLVCHECKVAFPIVSLDVGEDGKPFGEYTMVCPRCGHVDRYQATEIQSAVAHRKQ
ncbi:MAG: hypothetical protein WDZ83_05310 [Rhizobiaceae bacterium]